MSLFDDPGVGAVAEPTFSVGELSDAIGRAVRAAFGGEVWVRGEIHDLSRPASGHVYLSLVEQREDGSLAQLPVMLSAAHKVAVNRALTRAGGAVRMVDGTEVRIRGRLDWYGPRGQLQLRMTAIDPAYTLGQLEVARAQLLARLREEGLLGRQPALVLPPVPLRVGLVTSRGSAAEADFLDELRRSGLAFDVLSVDVRVQGAGAPRSVARGIASAAGRACDVIALVRGGGARTDLAAFDDELVARTIAGCPVPVITGIGHETDRSVADDVAHRSEKTPTACAQLLVARVASHLARVEETWSIVARLTQRHLAAHDAALRQRSRRAARGVERCLGDADQRLAGVAGRLRRAGAVATARSEQRLGRDLGRLDGATRLALREARTTLAGAEQRLAGRAPRVLAEAERVVAAAEARVRALDPQRALARGWSITTALDGRLVRSEQDVRPGDRILTRLADGALRSTVDGDD